MFRVLENRLKSWKESSTRKPLILRGARQIGKTWVVHRFGTTQFEKLVTIDFEKRRDLHKLFEGNLDPKNILKSIELLFGKIPPGKTLLFFDEIQACPRAIMALRYFYEEIPTLHVIAAGSLLEFAFDSISVPVGRVSYLYLYPLTFYEYLLAVGKGEMAEEVLSPDKESSEFIQRAILEELKNYFLVGGMPEAVKTFVETNSLAATFEVQDEILTSYRDDFSKYKPQIDIHCLDTVFKQAALRAGEQIIYTTLDAQFSGQTNRKAIDLLEKAKIINKIASTNPSGLPLGASVNERKFKLSFLDIGLMQRLSKMPIPEDYFQKDLLSVYQGKLAEQFVAQEIVAVQSDDLYYWVREAKSSTAEVDFLIISKGAILPIEVKSGKGGSLRSMHQILKDYDSLKMGAVLYGDIYKVLPEQKLYFYPIYFASSLVDKRGMS